MLESSAHKILGDATGAVDISASTEAALSEAAGDMQGLSFFRGTAERAVDSFLSIDSPGRVETVLRFTQSREGSGVIDAQSFMDGEVIAQGKVERGTKRALVAAKPKTWRGKQYRFVAVISSGLADSTP